MRLPCWVNGFNSYFVPFNFFDKPTVVRLPSANAIQFLKELGKASGSDRTRSEPNGELGLVAENDPQWQNQIGNSRDPQPGIIPDVLVDTLGKSEDDRNRLFVGNRDGSKLLNVGRNEVGPFNIPDTISPIPNFFQFVVTPRYSEFK